MAIEDLLVGIGILALIGIGMFLMTRSNNQKQKIRDAILISKVYSVSQIASLAGARQDKAITYIQYLITNANNGERAWRILRGAHLDLNKMEIILAEIDPADEAPTLSDLANKAKKVVHSKLAQHLPEAPKEPWTCSYCRSANDEEELVCQSCKAAR